MSEFLDHAYLQEVAETVIKKALSKGASQAEVSLARSKGIALNVRKQELETFEYMQNQSASIQIYLNQRKARVSSSDFSKPAIEKALDAALSIVKYTDSDPDFYLAEKELLAFDYPRLELDFPINKTHDDWQKDAFECEAAALGCDGISNSDGAAVDTTRSVKVYANSHGFNGEQRRSRYSLSVAMIAGKDDNMQQDYHYTVSRNPDFLQPASTVGKKAAERTLAKMNPQTVKTAEYPVLFNASIAAGLFAAFISAISGSSLYKNLSFLPDSIDKEVFPNFISLKEQPHLAAGLASSAYDGEGVKTRARSWLKGGIVTGYVLNSYTGRKLKLPTSGNAGGVRNLQVEAPDKSLGDLLKTMDRGVYIMGLMGQGINSVTGDYSQGAHGFWVENGVIQYPVAEITIAGNLKQMYKNIRAIANDVDKRHNIQTGSVLIENMTVSGNKHG